VILALTHLRVVVGAPLVSVVFANLVRLAPIRMCRAIRAAATALIRPAGVVDPAAFTRGAKAAPLNHRLHGPQNPHAPQHGVGVSLSRWAKDGDHLPPWLS
jgi:hypothetical protein